MGGGYLLYVLFIELAVVDYCDLNSRLGLLQSTFQIRNPAHIINITLVIDQ